MCVFTRALILAMVATLRISSAQAKWGLDTRYVSSLFVHYYVCIYVQTVLEIYPAPTRRAEQDDGMRHPPILGSFCVVPPTPLPSVATGRIPGHAPYCHAPLHAVAFWTALWVNYSGGPQAHHLRSGWHPR